MATVAPLKLSGGRVTAIPTTDDVNLSGLTLNTLTAGSILFAGAGGVVSQSNADLFWDNTNKRLGIGITPAWPLHVDSSTVGSSIVADVYSAATSPNIAGRRARGTVGLPTASLSGDRLINFGGRGHTGAAFSVNRGALIFYAAEDWGVAAQGTAAEIQTTLNGTTTVLTRLFVAQNGNVGIGAFTTAGGPLAKLHIKQLPSTSGGPNPVLLTAGGAHTTLTAAEAIDHHFGNPSRTVQFTGTGGSFAQQRTTAFEAQTYSATAAHTVNEAATVFIGDSPIAGTNLTITDRYALWCSGDNATATAYFDLVQGAGAGERMAVFGQTTIDTGATHTGGLSALRGLANIAGAVVASTEDILGVDGQAVQGSTGAITSALVGIRGAAMTSGASVVLGTVSSAQAVAGIIVLDATATSTAITDAYCFRAHSPEGTSAGHTIGVMAGLFVPNMGATGITTAIGIDIEAQTGASSTNIGLRTRDIVLPERTSDPANIANAGRLYTKDAAGVTQLYYRASDSTVYALTPPGAGMAIGAAVSGATAGSILYVGAGPVLAEDNAGFEWISSGIIRLGSELRFSKEGARIISVLDSTTAPAAGGALSIYPGGGTAASGANNGQAGGAQLVRGGVGGAGTAGLVAGAGGNLDLYSGDAGVAGGGTGAASGNITMDTGIASSATAGTITIGGTNASALGLGRAGITTTITGAFTQASGVISMTGSGGTSSITSSSAALDITAGAASTWSTASGALTLTSAAAATWSTVAGVLTVDGAGGIDLKVGGSTIIQIDFTSNQRIGVFSATPALQQGNGDTTFTNNVTAGGASATIADFTDLTIYANDAATIRNNNHQLARTVKVIWDMLRLHGWLS